MSQVKVLLPGTYNSRDVGGLHAQDGVVRHGVLIRSDALAPGNPQCRNYLRSLRVRTVIDLRWANERDADLTGLTEIGVDVHHVPLLTTDFAATRIAGLQLEEVYQSILMERGQQLASAIRRLARRGALPAVVFCTAGKDRTGLVIALTLAAVGVLDEEIAADYSLTEEAMVGRFRTRIEATASLDGSDKRDLALRMAAPAATMHAVLRWLRDRYGGVGGYLQFHGMTQRELRILHHAIVAPEVESSETFGTPESRELP